MSNYLIIQTDYLAKWYGGVFSFSSTWIYFFGPIFWNTMIILVE